MADPLMEGRGYSSAIMTKPRTIVTDWTMGSLTMTVMNTLTFGEGLRGGVCQRKWVQCSERKNGLDATWVAENTAEEVPEELAEEHAPETRPNCI